MSCFRIEALRFLDLEPINLSIEPGECIALSGPSGSGKTMMLRSIADLDLHEGRIFLNDKACESFDAPDWRRRVSLLPAESGWWFDHVGPHMPNVQGDCLNRLGFDVDVMNWAIRRLSTGERQRLSFLRLLENEPMVLLLDEPTSGLDAANAKEVELMVAEYKHKMEAPVIWVSHDPDQIHRIADRAFTFSGKQLTESSKR
ncbi:MAG: ATP-binding cassette domain-containing protein [Candidatus Eisenbacteria bacterium]|uniref:ATP-binding cassette domain-containing protein n=1 Tax=Eiseniibacteriota bacterium TaxID=2212470 RepID=A0A948RY58_UNCEI|nr:ATP-binding cassette domain-containing protein [Candidatus Eisenbacteria bacterium]MBU1947506.1 ATP-binding cassette domain-containing protein [Candidatus Eisenbacteria bacterium]MBU2691727.1 ATP-binding cassette domain-containing protein [Candidatus Eisenbacteria bacterium]